MALLETLPSARWTERNPYDRTLLHFACMGDNVAAMVALLAHGLDVEAPDNDGFTPAEWAVTFNQPRVLAVLCATGANLRTTASSESTLLEFALHPERHECACVLLANGVRLSTAREEQFHFITSELRAFEHGVLRCRAVAATLLGIKRRRGPMMFELDRFVILEIAVCMWATRADNSWHSNNMHAN